MDVVSTCPLRVASIVWRARPDAWSGFAPGSSAVVALASDGAARGCSSLVSAPEDR